MRPSGVTNSSGMPLDVAATGQAGSNYVTTITGKNLDGWAGNLPTIGLVDAARTYTAAAKISTQHTHAILYNAAVDRLLETGSSGVPRRVARD
jgi:hypothetical protein